jgi:hypothetical protein
MNEPFIPLQPNVGSAPERTDLRVAIITPTVDPQPFRALPHALDASAGPKSACKPNVMLQRDGDRVSAIRIQCSCGQIVELTCVYPPPPTRS